MFLASDYYMYVSSWSPGYAWAGGIGEFAGTW